MITRQQISEELSKHQDKNREFKKEKILELIVNESQTSKDKILGDLDSYAEY